MSKFHINSKGFPAPCKAEKGKCPLGGEHFDTLEAAKKKSEEDFKKDYGIISGMKEKTGFYTRESLEDKFPNLTKEQVDKVQKYVELEEKVYNESEVLRKSSDEYKATDEYFDKVQEVRNLALEKYRAHGEVKGFVEQEELDNVVTPMLPEKKPWKKSANYTFHPEIDKKNFNYGIGPVMSSYSGKPIEQIKAEIEMMQEEGESLHKASERYWKTLKQRTDKPIVSLDLETANPQDKSLDYDNGNGQLTYVIELGAIKTYPDGRVERLDFTSGVPKDFSDRNGTGFQNIHNITVDELKGQSEFSADEEKQKKVMEFLNGSVVIAHNANFEKTQLTNSLRGFRKEVNEGNIELLDTMNFCKFMVPESARNTNEAFVEAAGYEYKGAHRAMSDAEMTLKAFNKLKER